MKFHSNIHAGRLWLVAMFMLFFRPPCLQAQIVDSVVAIVNDDVITSSEVEEEGRAIFQRLSEESPPNELRKTLKRARKAIIQKMIDKKIILLEARRLHVVVSDEEVERAIQRVLKQGNISLEQLKKQLASAGVTEHQYRLNLKNQLLGSRLVSRELGSKIIISDESIINYYNSHYKGQVLKKGYHILQIGCNLPSALKKNDIQAARSEALKRIERIRMLAMSARDFKELARKYSDLPSAVDGGDIGFFNQDEMAQYMLEAISAIKPGEVSKIIKTATGYQFYKLLSIRAESVPRNITLESARDEIYKILFEKEMKGEYDKWIKELRSQAYIKIL